MKKILFMILFLGFVFAQNTDKQTVVKSANQALIDSFEKTLELLRVKIISGSTTETAPVFSRYTVPDSLFTAGATDTTTTVWKNAGAVIDMRGYTQLNIFMTIDINTTVDFRVRAIGMINDSTGTYPFTIETVSSTDVKVSPEYIEFNTDADQLAVLKIQTDGVPYVQIQYSAGTAGSGKILSSYKNKIWK